MACFLGVLERNSQDFYLFNFNNKKIDATMQCMRCIEVAIYQSEETKSQ